MQLFTSNFNIFENLPVVIMKILIRTMKSKYYRKSQPTQNAKSRINKKKTVSITYMKIFKIARFILDAPI